ncbi:cytochrome P450 [Amycolatopsis sp. cg13]|uniref:cytochrome P450 n=1 Tax=Amycolatopsis sp. cg13 TaxID=3238807 RepID=UPI0035242C28
MVTDQDDTLAEDELVMLVATVLTGGFLSTVNELTLVFLCLLRHPRQTALVREHPELLPGAVDELLRYNAPTAGGGLLRIATEDVQLGGVTISAGDAVLPAISSANRDSGVFADADRFDVTRADNRHLTYGRGPHFCLGAGLASLELEIAIAGVLRRFPALRLAVRPAELGVRSGHLMRGLTRLPVRW